jgi:hypothetical protein
VTRAVSYERPSTCHIYIKSTVHQGGVCLVQKAFKSIWTGKLLFYQYLIKQNI